jgi:dienelactone hydrolase
MLSAVPPLLPIDQLLAMLPSEPDEELTYDPVPDHAQLTCPVMLQWGEHDTSVPVAQSAERVSQARPDALLRVYPGVEHMLNVAITDVEGISPEEAMYGFHGFRFASAARVELTDVLRQVTGQTGPVTT